MRAVRRLRRQNKVGSVRKILLRGRTRRELMTRKANCPTSENWWGPMGGDALAAVNFARLPAQAPGSRSAEHLIRPRTIINVGAVEEGGRVKDLLL